MCKGRKTVFKAVNKVYEIISFQVVSEMHTAKKACTNISFFTYICSLLYHFLFRLADEHIRKKFTNWFNWNQTINWSYYTIFFCKQFQPICAILRAPNCVRLCFWLIHIFLLELISSEKFRYNQATHLVLQ